MAFAPIPEYEGKSPYVFISYAQQDERIAYSIAVKMYNEGFRLWSSAACGNPSSSGDEQPEAEDCDPT